MRKLAHYCPYDVKLGLLAHSRSFLTNQKARSAIVGAKNLLNGNIQMSFSIYQLFQFLYYKLTNIQMHTPAKEDIKRLKTTIGHVPKIALNSSPPLLIG